MSLDTAVLVRQDLFCLTRLKTLPTVDPQKHADFLKTFRRQSGPDARIKIVQYQNTEGFARGTWVPLVYLDECLNAIGVTDGLRKEIYNHIQTNRAVVLPPQESYNSFQPVLAPAFTETEMPISPPKRSPNKRPCLSSSRPTTASSTFTAMASPPLSQNLGTAIPEFASVSSLMPSSTTPSPSLNFVTEIPTFEFEPSFARTSITPPALHIATPSPVHATAAPNPAFATTLLQGFMNDLTDLRQEMADRHAREQDALAQDARERQAMHDALMRNQRIEEEFHAQMHELEERGGPVEVILSRLGALEEQIVDLRAREEELTGTVEQLGKELRGMAGMDEVRAMQMDALLERIQALEAGFVAM